MIRAMSRSLKRDILGLNLGMGHQVNLAANKEMEVFI